mmetsp:Transcript_28264/g.68776  ORF Transcript_28264/g.68776 Transcript_28264/m.68776 type:complete len:208 (-) Transcript_28264:1135-1758(-)
MVHHGPFGFCSGPFLTLVQYWVQGSVGGTQESPKVSLSNRSRCSSIMKDNVRQVIRHIHKSPEFIGNDTIVQDGKVKGTNGWSFSHSIMPLAPNIPTINSFHSKDRIIPQELFAIFIVFGLIACGFVKDLILRGKLIVGHIGTGSNLPGCGQTFTTLVLKRILVIQVSNQDLTSNLASQGLPTKLGHWLDFGVLWNLGVAIENIVLL